MLGSLSTKTYRIKFVPFISFFMFLFLCMNALAVAATQPLLIQKTGDYRVYYVSSSYKYHIPDPETFEILGFKWSDIKTVTQTEFDSYLVDYFNSKLRTGGIQDGSLVRRGSDIRVYLLNNGIRRWIPDPDTLYAMGRWFGQVIQLDDTTFSNIPEGTSIPSIDSNPDDFITFVSDAGTNCAGFYAQGVNIATGSYTYQKTDLAIPGRGIPFEFSRTYNAKDSDDSILGQGWTHSYNITATEVQKTSSGGTTSNLFVRLKWGNGQKEWYQWDGAAYRARYGMHNTVAGGSGTNALTVTTRMQLKYTLERVGDPDSKISLDPYGNQTVITTNRYRLKSISDRNGNTVTLDYSGGMLSAITDSSGRNIVFTYSVVTDPMVTYRLTKITDPIGRTVEFTYNTDGRLTVAKDMNGWLTRFIYNDSAVMGMPSPLIRTVTDPRGYPEVSNNYAGYKQADSIRMGVDSPTNFIYSSGSVEIKDPVLNIARKYAVDSKGMISSIAPTGDLNDRISIDRLDTDSACAPSIITDRLGRQTRFDYDASGNVLTATEAATDALENVTRFEYNDSNNPNNPTKKSEAYGTSYQRVTTYTYDSKGNLTRIVMSIGTINIAYTAYGQPETVTDPNGNTSTYIYDTQGNVAEIREPLSRTTKFYYDGVGRKTSETDGNNNTTYFTYDNNNNILSIRNALNQTAAYRYDANGNRTAVTDENGIMTTYTHDERNRLKSVTDPVGGVTGYLYDSFNRLIQMTAADGKSTRYEYDAVGNLIRVTDADGETVIYTYDSNGNRLSMAEPNGHITNYTYDALNRLSSRREPLGNQYSYSYDAVGNLISMTDAKNNTTSYVYDFMNRLTRITYPGGSSVSFGYDNNGNRASMTDSLGPIVYSYDALNRLVRYTDPFGKVVGYEYDGNNNSTTIIYPDGKRVQYGYDVLNRLTSVRDWFNRTSTYSYDPASRLTKTVNPNGTFVSYSYDNAGRLTGMINRKSNNIVISSYNYRLDTVGNHLQSAQIEPLLPVTTIKDVSYTHDAENRLISGGGTGYSFDSNGNMIGRGSNDSFSYDYRDKLIQSIVGGRTTQYGYDGAGNRLSRTENGITKRYVLDINSDLPNVLAETDGNGAITAYYVYGLGLISKILPDGTVYFYHYDSRGSTVALTDAGQNITDTYAYDPFGKVVNSTGSTPNPFKYIGRYGLMDEGNGLTYIRARYYAPEVGRFVTKDLLTGQDGDGQSLNRYAYAVNNPVRLVDVDGLFAKNVAWAGMKQYGKGLGHAGMTIGTSVLYGMKAGKEIRSGNIYKAVLTLGTGFIISMEHLNEMEKSISAGATNIVRSFQDRDAVSTEDMQGRLDEIYKVKGIKNITMAVKYSNAFVNFRDLSHKDSSMSWGEILSYWNSFHTISEAAIIKSSRCVNSTGKLLPAITCFLE